MLEELIIDSDTLANIDVSKSNNLKKLIVTSKANVTANIGKKDNLEIVRINSGNANNVTIDLKDAVNIKEIELPSSNLTELKLNSESNKLTYVNLALNELEEFDVTKHTNLVYLDLGHNNIKSIDLSNNELLKTINLGYNMVEELKTTYFEFIEYVNINRNKIENINFEDFKNAKELWMDESISLKGLDLYYLSNLKVLSLKDSIIHIDRYLTESQIVSRYNINYSRDEVYLSTVEDFMNLTNTTSEMYLALQSGKNVHTATFYYNYSYESSNGSGVFSSTFQVETQIHIPDIQTEKYIEYPGYIYIKNDLLDVFFDNVEIIEGYATINGNKLEIRHREEDEDPCETKNIEYARSSYITSENTITIDSDKTELDLFNSFSLSSGTNLKLYRNYSEISPTDKKLEGTYKIEIYLEDIILLQTYIVSIDGETGEEIYIDPSVVVTEEEGKPSVISNITLNTKISDLENIITTYGNITYQNKSGEELTLDENDKIYTGLVIVITLPENEYTYVASVKGDVTGTGSSSISDVMRIVDHVLNDNKLTETPYLLASDLNDDGNISISDVMALVNQILS